MNPATDIPEPDRFRSYLRVLARLQFPAHLAAKVDASDVVQQTLIQAYRALDGFQGRTEAEMAGWLRQILTNNVAHAARDFARQKRDAGREVDLAGNVEDSSARLEAWLTAEQTSPTQRVERNEQLVSLSAALDALPPDQREAIELQYLRGWTLSQIAAHQGRTVGSVAGLVHRGLAKLKEQMPE